MQCTKNMCLGLLNTVFGNNNNNLDSLHILRQSSTSRTHDQITGCTRGVQILSCVSTWRGENERAT
jgi:hypothetical protein